MVKYIRQKEYFKGAFHHVYSRGVDKQIIFKDNQDYIYFLKRLRHYKNKYEIDILSYCFMPNHFHFLTFQLSNQPLSKMMQYLLNGYVMYFNKRYDRKGCLFEEKFRAISIGDEGLLLHLSKYIHLNPLTAGLVTKIEKWSWSSYLDYINMRSGTLSNKKLILKEIDVAKYKKFCEKETQF